TCRSLRIKTRELIPHDPRHRCDPAASRVNRWHTHSTCSSPPKLCCGDLPDPDWDRWFVAAVILSLTVRRPNRGLDAASSLSDGAASCRRSLGGSIASSEMESESRETVCRVLPKGDARTISWTPSCSGALGRRRWLVGWPPMAPSVHGETGSPKQPSSTVSRG